MNSTLPAIIVHVVCGTWATAHLLAGDSLWWLALALPCAFGLLGAAGRLTGQVPVEVQDPPDKE